MSLYFDDKLVAYRDEASIAKCDKYSEELIVVKRYYAQVASERQAIEETLDEVVSSYVQCFVDNVGIDQTTYQPKEYEKSEGSKKGSLDERFYELIIFEKSIYNYFKYSFSQKLYSISESE